MHFLKNKHYINPYKQFDLNTDHYNNESAFQKNQYGSIRPSMLNKVQPKYQNFQNNYVEYQNRNDPSKKSMSQTNMHFDYYKNKPQMNYNNSQNKSSCFMNSNSTYLFKNYNKNNEFQNIQKNNNNQMNNYTYNNFIHNNQIRQPILNFNNTEVPIERRRFSTSTNFSYNCNLLSL